jgi:hypothetical protein
LSAINNDILGYNISYAIHPQIQFKNLPSIHPDIQYRISEDRTNLVGFIIKITNTNMNKATKEGNNIADKIVSFITSKTFNFLSVTQTGISGIPKPNKTAAVIKNTIHCFNIEGSKPILNLQNQDTMNLLKLDDEQHGLLHRFAQAILYYTSNLPIDAFRELFAIIEYEKGFPDYDKYYGLRQILLHRPDLGRFNPYDPHTIKKFIDNFNENDFDYIEYKPTSNIIIINTNSLKSKIKMDEIVSKLLFSNDMKKYIQNKCNFSNPL